MSDVGGSTLNYPTQSDATTSPRGSVAYDLTGDDGRRSRIVRDVRRHFITAVLDVDAWSMNR